MRDQYYREIIAAYRKQTAVLHIAQGVNAEGRIVGCQNSTSQPAQVERVRQIARSADNNRWPAISEQCRDFIQKYA